MRTVTKFCLLVIFCLGVAGNLQPMASVRGIVTHRISGCDYFLVEARTGYDLLEWYGGYDPDKGDTVVGNFETYGFHDILDESADETTRIYTEDYQLSKTSA